MNAVKTKAALRSPLKWHGGKSYLAGWIVAKFPAHRRYVEPFAGGLSVLLNTPRCEAEVVNDLDPDLMRFWLTVRDRGEDVARRLAEIPYCREAFEHAPEAIQGDDDLEAAVAFMARSRMSIGGTGRGYSWSDRLRGGQPECLNSWDTIRDAFPAVVERVRGVEMHCCDALDVIRDEVDADTVLYLDPPYLKSTRTATDVYGVELSRSGASTGEDELRHMALLKAALDAPGKRFISGYPSKLYDDTLKGWTRHDRPMKNHAGVGATKQDRVECLWESP